MEIDKKINIALRNVCEGAPKVMLPVYLHGNYNIYMNCNDTVDYNCFLATKYYFSI